MKIKNHYLLQIFFVTLFVLPTAQAKTPSDNITGTNFVLSYNTLDVDSANSAKRYIEERTKFYKLSPATFFTDQTHIFNIVLCHDQAEFNLNKPVSLPDFETSYTYNNTIYLVNATTDLQKNYFSSFEQVIKHGFAQQFLVYAFNNNVHDWLKYGFARYEAGMEPNIEQIRNEKLKFGKYPTMSEMRNWGTITGFDKYAFAYTVANFLITKFGYGDIEKTKLIFSGTTLSYNFWSITSESDFDKTWQKFLDIFYLYDDQNVVKLQKITEHFKIYMCALDTPYLTDISNIIETKVAQYFTNLQLTSDYKITFFIYPSLCDYHNSVNIDVCNPNSIGGGGNFSFQMVTPRDIGGLSDGTKGLIAHELSHVIQFLIRPNFMPAWLSEGFASFLPDGVISDQTIRNLSGEVNHRMEKAKQTIGHYPTIAELEDYDFVGTNSIDYYLLGYTINDFIVKNFGYNALKQIILSNGQNFSSAGYASKQEFEAAYYKFYDEVWKPKPKIVSIKKVIGKPFIDGNLTEPTWEKNINIDRKFWMEYVMTTIPTIDNSCISSMMWDDENLYIAIDVVDENISSNLWLFTQNDGVELDIDPDLSRSIDFTDSDMAFIWTAGTNQITYRTKLTGANIASVNTPTGYAVEVSIPWVKLGIMPTAGKKIGLELCNYDRDNDAYKGALIFSGHSWNNGIVLNGLAEVTLSDETITAPRASKISYPIGDESFIAGDSAYIKWGYTNIAEVRIDYSTDNGTSWNLINTFIPTALSASDSCSWFIPNIITANAKVRIVDATNNLVLDESKTTFRIIKANNTGGPYLSDSNAVVLLHFENTLDNKSKLSDAASGVINGSSYEANTISDLGKSVKLQSPITISHNANLNLSGDWTIEAWVKFNSYLPNTDAYLVQKPGDNNAYFANYALEVNPYWENIFYGFYFDQGNNRIGLSGATPSLNKWYHITFIRDTQKKQLKLLLRDENRKLISSLNGTYSGTSVLTNSNDLVIGGGFDGYIDELRISNIVREFRSLSLLSPNGGENLKAGSTFNITWSSQDIQNIKLEYSTNGGTSWTSITNSFSATSGSYAWMVSNVTSTNCKIRISDQTDPSFFDSSDSTFTIAPPPALTLIQPNGGERWYSGSQHDITWTSQNITDVNLYYSTDNGSHWSIIAAASTSSGKYTWTIPTAVSKTCKIQICSTADTNIVDASNKPFAITPVPSLTIKSPNGGEVWKTNTIETISWTAEYVDSVKIEHSINGGSSWSLAKINSPADSGQYQWSIPNTPSKTCLVKITDLADSTIFDSSNNQFTIELVSSNDNWAYGMPDRYELFQNYPNPFNPTSKIRYQVLKPSFVQILLYDVLGKEIKRLVNEIQNGGYYEVELNGGDLCSGIYFLKMNAEAFSSIKKIILMK